MFMLDKKAQINFYQMKNLKSRRIIIAYSLKNSQKENV